MKPGDFTENASVYEAARPGYPEELVSRLIDDSGVDQSGADRPSVVAEIGAGTGKFTRCLAERGFHVTALEPNAAMRDEAPPLPGVTWTDGAFSATGLESESQDWVIAAQSFHWAKPETDLPEMRRILRRGGRLTLLWNDRQNDRHEVLQWTVEMIRGIVPEYDEAYRQLEWDKILISTGDFLDVRTFSQEHVFPMTPAQYVNYWRSHNRFGSLAGATRRRQVLDKLAEHLHGDDQSQILNIPLVCMAWSAARV